MGTVDYILITADDFRPRQLLPTPPRAELAARGSSWPDWDVPSDHVPIAADLQWM